MDDRDTFAAAALTGLLANGDYSVESIPLLAYQMADAMLARRNPPAKPSDVAEACATAQQISDAQKFVRTREEFEAWQTTASNADPAETDTTQPRNGALSPDPDSRVLETQRTPPPHPTPPQGSVPGEGGFPDSRTANEPVAWVAWFDFEDKPDADFLFRNKEQADCWCRKRGADSVPLYLHPAPAVTAEPVAWWLRGPAWWPRGTEYDTGCEYEFVSLFRESADAAAKEGGTVTPLYAHPQPTLTDEEREAVEWAASAASNVDHPAEATLRKLLERMT